MAEAVRTRLERRTVELHDLLELEIFSEDEIKKIVRKREQFEYLLRRRTTRKGDFLDYIDYEQNLEQLRRRRKRARRVFVTGRYSDASIVNNLHSLYMQALTKFKDDLELWKQYFAFCKEYNSWRRLSKAYAECLRYHGHCPEVWIEAAEWEFQHNANSRAARALLQRGLRVNKGSQALFLEYFRLEVAYWQKMLKRAELLGIDVSALELQSTSNADKTTQKGTQEDADEDEASEGDEDEDEEGANPELKPTVKLGGRKKKSTTRSVVALMDGEEEEEAFDGNESGADDAGEVGEEEVDSDEDEDLYDVEEEAKEANQLLTAVKKEIPGDDDDKKGVMDQAEDEEEEEEEEDGAMQAARQAGTSFYSGIVPRLIYFSAIEQYPNDMKFRNQFLEVYRCYKGTETSRDVVYASLPVDNVAALDLICRRPLEDHYIDAKFSRKEKREALTMSDALYCKALASFPSARLRGKHVEMLQDSVYSFTGDKSLAGFTQHLLRQRCRQYANANDDHVSPTAVVALAKEKAARGELKSARKTVNRCLLRSDLQQNVELWQMRVDLALKEGVHRSIVSALRDALVALDASRAHTFAAALWQLHKTNNDVDGMQVAVRLAAEKKCGNAHALCCAHARYLATERGPQPARDFLQWCVVVTQAYGLQLYLTWVDIEMAAHAPDSAVRAVFEDAVSRFGKYAPRLWERYILFEQDNGRPKESSQLRWRAFKTLTDPTVLEQRLK